MYRIDLTALTIIATTNEGETDLNDGAACTTYGELAEFIGECETLGLYGPDVTAELLATIDGIEFSIGTEIAAGVGADADTGTVQDAREGERLIAWSEGSRTWIATSELRSN